MFFNSLYFLLFFVCTAVLYYLIPLRFRWWLLLTASLVFYAAWNPCHILILLAITAISFGLGCLLQKATHSRLYLGSGIGLCLLFLIAFRYAAPLARYFNASDSILSSLAAPIGISFFTLKAIGYIIDCYRGEPCEKNFFKYLLYISFFPQITSGPIARSGQLLPQLTAPHRFDRTGMQHALYRMLIGYFKKMVIADNLSTVVSTIFDTPSHFSPIILIGGTVLYAIQILCDFSGYSDIAIGCAKLFGIDTCKNFDHPYLSANTAAFWKRWHISLSSWFRDYVYIPLGGNRVGTVRKYLNITMVFLLSGLWHGNSWNFVFWSLLHAAYRILGDMTAPFRQKAVRLIKLNRLPRIHKCIRILITFTLVCFAWIFFRSESITDGLAFVKGIFTNDLGAFSLSALIAQAKLLFSAKTTLISTCVSLFLFAAYALVDCTKGLYASLQRRHWVLKVIFYALLIVCVLLFASTGATDFIYTRF